MSVNTSLTAGCANWELTDLGVEPIPSVRTIGRLLARATT